MRECFVIERSPSGGDDENPVEGEAGLAEESEKPWKSMVSKR